MHLTVYLFSEDYPYKEVLDLMANRCLAERTNAWTDTDHTCYTVYTAGSAGFINILPVYMDHILHPTLREQDFLTEVHHVNGNGEDAGVVYSEMQVKTIYFDKPLNLRHAVIFLNRVLRIRLRTSCTLPWPTASTPGSAATSCRPEAG